MATVQTTLTEQEFAALQSIAQKTGKPHDELLHEALKQFIKFWREDEPTPRAKSIVLARRRELLRQARGMWKDRTDLPSLEQLRAELDRWEP